MCVSEKKNARDLKEAVANDEGDEDEFVVLRKSKTMPQVESRRSPSSEVENYLCEEHFARGQQLNPLEYWKLKETQGDFRGLCTLARGISVQRLSGFLASPDS